MATIDDIKYMIELDGGVVHDVSQHLRLGWRFVEPSKEEIEEFNTNSSINYWSKFLIDAYAGTTCFRVNSELRNQHSAEPDEFCQLYKFHLNQSLDELPAHENQTVWRWVSMSDEGINFLKNNVGKKVMFPHFLSTSDYKNLGYSSFFEIKTCENSNARYIAEVVNKLSEREVLFKSNTVLKIDSSSQHAIYLTEVRTDEYDLVLHQNFWEI